MAQPSSFIFFFSVAEYLTAKNNIHTPDRHFPSNKKKNRHFSLSTGEESMNNNNIRYSWTAAWRIKVPGQHIRKSRSRSLTPASLPLDMRKPPHVYYMGSHVANFFVCLFWSCCQFPRKDTVLRRNQVEIGLFNDAEGLGSARSPSL